MPLQFDVGDKFPSFSLLDPTGELKSIEEIGDGKPLLLALFRGPW